MYFIYCLFYILIFTILPFKTQFFILFYLCAHHTAQINSRWWEYILCWLFTVPFCRHNLFSVATLNCAFLSGQSTFVKKKIYIAKKIVEHLCFVLCGTFRMEDLGIYSFLGFLSQVKNFIFLADSSRGISLISCIWE